MMMMRGGERVKEFLRPFVDSRTWDLCVIWKLGDDPSRFIEWVGCCCSGCYIDKNIKLENSEEGGTGRKKKASFCRDDHNKHRIRTLACEALSRFPLFMPLYPGIHGEVVMSKSPKWLVNSGSKMEMFSTRVLVPVSDGLVELFAFDMRPFDESMVHLIMSRCTTFFEPFPEQRLQFRIIPRAEESMSSGVNLSVEGGGSSSVSNPSSETQNLFGNYPNASCVEILREEQTPCLIMNKEKDVVVQNANDSKANKKLLPTENFKSKNLHSERKRRERINQAMYGLRAVVPKITKLNKIGIFSDAVDYINELLVEKQKLEDELKGINEMECKEIAAEEQSAIADPEAERVSSKSNKRVKKNEVKIEVHETGERDFLIRVVQEHKQDGFKRLIEAVDLCELEIIDVNFTRLDLTVMTVLNVKANKDGIACGILRDLLLKMMITSI
ncbi:Transcription factor bHLH90 [Arabidopsis thaliana]|jgi:hypothetical protein|uniref:Transcription factor bHLH90 n=4 Tax=Arabidopsis TaxID=3701 RepID=BH090_ARATH|nr:basic helix-loop-helix (bHLH) DNA-binding superfamily protein [Arabidopsis thaliana]Q0WNR2.1 RecName: Full=Transcription factor bHLH90; AltName: Full=Basic helix-loop-helix protein 90; Short=AtbHLH90; Short=bHLH 90; AltName: Full=Transcription factor EN 50; AltName: Full=bHLH transcription factor bHLH090 [Arabidopsis thaliana]KAG7596566.1 Myc-type basic helix-loop-helix (bHLH) domain [Arabidopsis suecica]KAG7645835.1 Myc-type basic helix-loop-helix (bHLH) domain [Arabidopsis thaliana x Arabid|eukprot:NP_172531.2 basic helix-loop-helix (bHLH) DNA-binding superfamily protein [Arabidopsis thaliana]